VDFFISFKFNFGRAVGVNTSMVVPLWLSHNDGCSDCGHLGVLAEAFQCRIIPQCRHKPHKGILSIIGDITITKIHKLMK